jgi:hypothetical protein
MNGRLLLSMFLLIAAAALAAGQAKAKEGVFARVLTPIDRDAAPGTTVTVVWTLYYVDEGKRHPFGGEDVFIRFFGAVDSRSKRVYAAPIREGRYRATVTVPRGGVRRVVIGLMGTACGPDASGNQRCRPSPMFFRIAGDPFANT